MPFCLAAESFFEPLTFLTQRVVIERRRFAVYRIGAHSLLQDGIDVRDSIAYFLLSGHVGETVLSRLQALQDVWAKISKQNVSMTRLLLVKLEESIEPLLSAVRAAGSLHHLAVVLAAVVNA